MGDAYTCDATGKVAKGAGCKSILAELPNGNALLIVPQRRVGKKRFTQGEISPAAEKKLQEALKELFAPKRKKGGAS